jgi:phenylacetate-CoA ligase
MLEQVRHSSRRWLLENLFLPAGDLFVGSKMMSRLKFLRKAQWWDRDVLVEEQKRLLSEVIRISYSEVPFYRELMERSNIKPEDIQSREALSKIPVVTKESIRNSYPHKTTRKTGFKTFENHTSGSTGYNFCVLVDSETSGWYRASFLAALEWAGWQIGDRHLQTGVYLERTLEKRLKDLLLGCHYVSAFHLKDEQLDAMLHILENDRIQFLWGYPSGMYFLARRAKQLGWNQPMKAAVTWGDTLFPEYRKMIESAFQTRVFDTYGCAEGIQIAAQCGEEKNYHIHSLDVIVEYLDDRGDPVKEGQTGNLVLTRLFAGPMPLIRYQVGDVGVSGASRSCVCGRQYEIMDSILGRETDFVLTPSGNRLIVHFFRAIIERFPEVDSFQVVQDSADSVWLRLVPSENFTKETPAAIVSVMKESGAAEMIFHTEVVNEIPLTAGGKRRFVISELAKPFLNETRRHL